MQKMLAAAKIQLCTMRKIIYKIMALEKNGLSRNGVEQ